MSLEHQVVKPKDLSKIDNRHVGELLWWSYYFDITLEKLVTILDEVGGCVELIRQKLEEHNSND
jgi:hypothetical protein